MIRRILVIGAGAATASALAAAAFGRLERGRAAPPLTAISHTAWGGRPPAKAGRAGVNLVTGLALHAGASLFWATPFELAFGRAARRSALAAWCAGALISAAASVTDYYVVPKRFRPGFEAFLSGRGLFAVYAALAAGLALGARSSRRLASESHGRQEAGAGREARPPAERPHHYRDIAPPAHYRDWRAAPCPGTQRHRQGS